MILPIETIEPAAREELEDILDLFSLEIAQLEAEAANLVALHTVRTAEGDAWLITTAENCAGFVTTRGRLHGPATDAEKYDDRESAIIGHFQQLADLVNDIADYMLIE